MRLRPVKTRHLTALWLAALRQLVSGCNTGTPLLEDGVSLGWEGVVSHRVYRRGTLPGAHVPRQVEPSHLAAGDAAAMTQ